MDLKYPIGQFAIPETIKDEQLLTWLDDIESLPRRLNQMTKELSEEQLRATYRPGSWTVKQVIHHIADSHLNSYIRMKLAVTGETPTVNTYDEVEWAKQTDYDMPIAASLNLLAGLHLRWVYFLRHLDEPQLTKKFRYPDGIAVTVKQAIGLYAWHGNHHLAHLEVALNIKV